MSALVKKIDQFTIKHNLIPRSSKIVLGFSGGPDSVFLFHLLAEKAKKGLISLIAAHLDHEWSSDSDKVDQFCCKMASALKIPYVSSKCSTLAIKKRFNGSKEEFARRMRRYFLENVYKDSNADFIALGHHVQDQQETFLIRLIRGATLTGLTAMRPKHGKYIRPLLEVNKIDIIYYLDSHNIEYFLDPTNESPLFLRNRIRNTVLPALRACDKRFDSNFLMTLNRLKTTEQFLEQTEKKVFEEISYIEDNVLYVNLKKFFDFNSALQYRLLMYWLKYVAVPFLPTQGFLEEIRRFLKRPGSKKHQICKQWLLIKKKELAYIQT